jgi:hypothetical protein
VARNSLYDRLNTIQPNALMGRQVDADLRRVTPQNAMMLGSMLPGVGDAIGLAGDAYGYVTDPSSRNMLNYGLTAASLIPGIPALGKMDDMAKKVDAVKAPDYGIAHRPPGRHYGAPAHELTRLLPDDIYGPNAARYYQHMGGEMDAATLRTLRSLRGKPDAMVKIYRAVPLDVPYDAPIVRGDWVTINKAYARSHGDSVLEGKFRTIETTVPAKDLYTSGDSIHEFGYDPE